MAGHTTGNLLFHAAPRLRAGEFNYISLETVLSEAGVISQVPMNWISLMTSGRSHVVDCGEYGHIEFVHTTQRPEEIRDSFVKEIRRFLPASMVRETVAKDSYWEFLIQVIHELAMRAIKSLK